MKHNYDTDQLKAAHKVAAKKISINELHTTKYLSAFLDALPEPDTDDWKECAWGDILPTDKRVKAEYASGTIIEGVPDEISDDGIYLSDGVFIWYSENAKWYRIPAPVQHPDPAEHPVIIDSGDAWFWNPHQEMYQQAGAAEYRFPEGFTNWGAAEVITTEPAEVSHDR